MAFNTNIIDLLLETLTQHFNPTRLDINLKFEQNFAMLHFVYAYSFSHLFFFHKILHIQATL